MFEKKSNKTTTTAVRLLLLTILLALCFGSLQAVAQTRDLTVVVLVNSANTAGYSTSASSPGEYQRYPERYLEHLQMPYRVIDVSTTAASDLSTAQLIVAGHRGLSLSSAWQAAITNAVAAGTGFVNLDSDPAIGGYSHIQTIFGATSSSPGTPSTSITVPLTVMQGGSAAHYITALQMKVPSDPAGDLIYSFHSDDNGVTGTATATNLNGARGSVLAKIGSDPLLTVTTYGSGRAVYFSTYDYLKADRFGFMMGVDDLFWRSLVWAARKPFVLRGYPRYFAIQMDDPVAGWATRVQDMYNPLYSGNIAADGTGGPWKVTGNIQIVNLDPGSSDRASVNADVAANKLHVSLHTNTGGSGGDFYWTGENPTPLTDAQWLANVNNALTWVKGNGGSDTIQLSASIVPHFWDLSNNTGSDMWNKFGTRYITEIQKPGSYYSSAKTNADRLSLHPFRIYELPPTYGNPAERWPIYYADDITVGSRAGLPSQTFFAFCTQLLGYTYPTFDASWPQDAAGISTAESLENFQAYSWRFWSGMAPVQIYTHDGGNMDNSTDAERHALIQQLSQWMAPRGVRQSFMSDLGAYMRARTKSVLKTATATPSTISLTFTGAAVDANGTPVTTKAYVFYGDNEGSLVDVAGFTNGSTTSFPNVTPPMLVVSSNALTFGALPGGANPPSQNVSISNGGTGTLSWTVSNGASWLSATPASGTNAGTVKISVNTSGLAAGTYTGNLTVTATGATNSPQVIAVTLYLNNPQLSVTPTALAFSGFQGQANPSPAQLQVADVGGGTLNWTAKSDSTWLTVSPASGPAPGTITVQANTTGLAIGNYTGHVTVTAPGAQNSPTVIPVTFSVAGVLMSSNFNDGTLNGWIPSPLGRLSSWSNVAGVVNYAGGGATQLYAGDANWTNYDVQAQMALTTLSDYPGGIRGRVNPATGASYALWVYPTEKTVKLYRTTAWNIDSGFTVLGVAGLVAIDTGTMHTVRLSFSGSSITVYFDGTLLLTATDTTLPSGMVALDVSSQPVQFDNVLVSGKQATISNLTAPAGLTFSAVAGGTAPAPQNLAIGSTGGILSWTAADDASWLTLSPASGTTPTTVTATASPTGLAGGNYSGHVVITAPAAGNNLLTVPITFNVQASPPAIALSATTLGFTAIAGQAPPTAQPVTITNAGSGSLSWTASPSASWIQVTPVSGTAPGQVSIGVSTTGLTNGSYSGTVTISASGVSNSPQTINVSLQVQAQDLNENFTSGAPGWVISPMGNAAGWSASSGAYTYSGAGNSQSCAGNTAWTDYTFSASVKLSNLSNYPGGIRGRVGTAGAGYALWLYPGSSALKLFRTTQWNIDGSGTVMLAQAAQTFDTAAHTVRMDYQGSSIYVYWDGVLTMQASDPGGLTAGFVCLEGASQPITFDNVQVLGTINNPQITAAPASLSFAAQQGAVAPAQTVQLTAGTAGMVYSAAPSSPWLTVSSSTMTTPGALTVTASAASLTSGSYSGSVIVTSPGTPNSPMSIPVTFSVNSASIIATPTSFDLVGATTQNPPAVPVAITNGGGGTLNWTASPGAAWLTASPTSGTAPSSASVTAASTSLAVGTYNGSVSFSSPQAGNGSVAAAVKLRVGNMLFSDDFSNGAGNWTVSSMGNPANWTVSSGGYTYSGAGASQSYTGTTSWTDYTFSTDVSLASLSNYPGGVRVRVNPSTGAGYGIWLYPGNSVIKVFNIPAWNIDAPGTTLLAQSGTIAFDTTKAHNIRVDVQGANISVYYDNVLAVQTTDTTYAGGGVAFDASNQPITYDNVRVISY